MTEIRYALRLLRKSPGFSLTAILTLALGIGVNSGIFSVVDAVMLRPLPYPHPEELVAVAENEGGQGGDHGAVAVANLRDYAQNHVLTGIVHLGTERKNLTGGGPPEQLFGVRATYNFFSVLGIQPALGRAFLPEEDRFGARHVTVLGHELWRRRFGGDLAIVGKSILYDGQPYTVVGVMPERFEAPLQFGSTLALSFYVPAAFDPELLANRGDHEDHALARLRPGVTLAQARAEMTAISLRLAQLYPKTNGNVRLVLTPLRRWLTGRVRTPLLVLLGAVGLVLLIACANVANLLLARGVGQVREVAIRVALGASRGRVLRELLAQSAVLAAAGCAAGLLAGSWVSRALVALAPQDIPRLHSAALNFDVVAFCLGLAAATVLIFGLLPALVTSNVGPRESLLAARGVLGGSAPLRWRGALMATEVGLALTLLIGSGLLLKSFLLVSHIDPGFRPDHVLILDVNLPPAGYPAAPARLAFFEQLQQRVERLPGVVAAGFGRLPLRGHWSSLFETAENPVANPPAGGLEADFQMVSAGYFPTLGIPVLQGRAFATGDRDGGEPVVIVNQALARRYYPNGSALGHRIRRLGSKSWRTIVGIVGEVHLFGQDQAVAPQVYLPAAQTDSYPMPIATFAMLATGPPLHLAQAVQREVWAIDKDQPVTRVASLGEVVSDSLAQRRFQMGLLLLFALLALTLALVGIYGVISYAVERRTAELGLRIALGARRQHILGMVVREGMSLVGLGIVLGLAGALASSRVLASLLFRVAPFDPATFAALAALAAATALAACLVPALRAARVDPMTALRSE
ncbi:MAG TPA: ABC transporter permease [Thermoanaerobaculia bacterium]|nr:ABC transporter permease [Thermoanaerobaculia bacterium]